MLAVDAAGGKSVASNTISVTVQPDTVPPTVSIVGLAEGSTISGTFTLQANASDNVLVAGVTFRLDGVAIAAEDTSAPYSISWLTNNATNGAHVITAVARDAANNTTVSAAVNVTISNSGAAVSGRPGRGLFLRGRYGHDHRRRVGPVEHGHAQRRSHLEHGRQVGKAVSFNGTSGMVTIADKASLDLTSAMTLSAWVNPSATGELADRHAQGSRHGSRLRALQFRRPFAAERHTSAPAAPTSQRPAPAHCR